jgi:phage-related protein
MDEREGPLKDLIWVGSSKRDYMGSPGAVQDDMGFALYLAQQGKEHLSAKALKGFGGRGVLELVESHEGNAYRAVYTVRFEGAVYVLHAFQKKSKRGIATPQLEIDAVKRRLNDAETIHQARTAGKGRR